MWKEKNNFVGMVLRGLYYKIDAWERKLTWAAFIFVSGCVPNNQVDFPSTKNYFPLQAGNYRIYSVSEIKIEPYNIETLSNYEIKTVVTDSFSNADGKYSYVISRFKRTSPADAWASLDTWMGRSNEREVVITEDNVPYQKISYPVEAARKWNGNTYNNEPTNEICQDAAISSCDLYTFGLLSVPFETAGGLSFENTVEVIENDDLDIFVKTDVRKTVYALNIGIVYREIKIKKYCTRDDCYGKQLVETGRVMVMELEEYGRE